MNAKKLVICLLVLLVVTMMPTSAFALDMVSGGDDSNAASTLRPFGSEEPDQYDVEDPEAGKTGEVNPEDDPEFVKELEESAQQVNSAYYSYTLSRNNGGQSISTDTYTLKLGLGSVTSYTILNIFGVEFLDGNGDQVLKDQITRVVIDEGVTEIGPACFYGFDSLQSVSLPSTLDRIARHAFAGCDCLNDMTIADNVELEEGALQNCGSCPTSLVPSRYSNLERAHICYGTNSSRCVSPDAAAGTTHVMQFDESYQKIEELLSGMDLQGKTDLQKLIAIYNWITANVDYDYEALEYKNAESTGQRRFFYATTAHSALFTHQAVCSGYTDLLKIMLGEAGVNCIQVSNSNHTWLMVGIDGDWYAVDATWDANFEVYGAKYFLRSYNFYTSPEGGHEWEKGNEIFQMTYPLSESDYGTVTSGNYKYRVYDDRAVLASYSGNSSKVTLPTSVNYKGNSYPVTSVGRSAFQDNDKLSSLTIPEGYETLNGYSFCGCKNLKNLSLPSTLKRIDMYAFYNCPLTVYDFIEGTVTYNGTVEQFREIAIDTSKNGCSVCRNYSLLQSNIDCSGVMYIPESNITYTVNKSNGFTYHVYNNYAKLKKYTGKAKEITLPKKVGGVPLTTICESAFSDNWDIRTVTINEGCTDIDEYAFYGCENLKKLTLPTTLKNVRFGAFWSTAEGMAVNYNGTVAAYKKIKMDMESGLLQINVKCSNGTFKSPYNLKNATVKVTGKILVYNGKKQLPKITVKNSAGTVLKPGKHYSVYYTAYTASETGSSKPIKVNYYEFFIEGEGYYANTYNEDENGGYSFRIIPQATKIKKLKKAGKGGIKVSYDKKSAQVTGYQIQAATNSKFTKNKKTINVKGAKNTAKTIKKLKSKKTYYVRVRTYKYVSDDWGKMYSKWSAVKIIKVQ